LRTRLQHLIRNIGRKTKNDPARRLHIRGGRALGIVPAFFCTVTLYSPNREPLSLLPYFSPWPVCCDALFRMMA